MVSMSVSLVMAYLNRLEPIVLSMEKSIRSLISLGPKKNGQAQWLAKGVALTAC